MTIEVKEKVQSVAGGKEVAAGDTLVNFEFEAATEQRLRPENLPSSPSRHSGVFCASSRHEALIGAAWIQ